MIMLMIPKSSSSNTPGIGPMSAMAIGRANKPGPTGKVSENAIQNGGRFSPRSAIQWAAEPIRKSSGARSE